LVKSNTAQERYISFNLPNLITGMRIILTLIVIFLLSTANKTASIVAGVIIIIAWITDFLDGYLARRLKLTTEAGGILDLAADRLLMISTLLITLFQGYWTRTAGLMPLNPYTYAVPVLAGDYAIAVGIIVFFVKRRKMDLKFPSPPNLARFTFSAQMATLVVAVMGLGPDWLLAGLMYLSLLLTLSSFYQYLKTGGYIFTR
jgi:CDP-diacylglycerol---glycerol-3-phosphate 3-phosphatidyltransferase